MTLEDLKGTEVTVEFCDRKEDVEKKVTDLLKETKESIYYYGGAGFISEYLPWRQALDEKLKNKEIKIVRLIDLKTSKEIKEVLKRIVLKRRKKEKDINTDADKYAAWLKLHAENLKSRVAWNAFYDFDGAPLWKYGIHQIIFDKRHVVIVFLSTKEVRNAIFIHNSPDIAKALVESMDWLVDVFDLKLMTGEELEKIKR